MYKIKKVILWPKNHNKSLRIIDFKLDKVNIIHGNSRTGKTALISCIDYTLGSKKCKIPVGEILDNTEWFGVLLISENEEILVARLSPSFGKKDGNYYTDIGKNIDIPYMIDKPNNNFAGLKRILNNKMNYTDEKMVVDDTSNFNTSPSYRDTAAFNFQPQTIIASPDILYYKVNVEEHRERLKREYLYFLGVIDNNILLNRIKQKELQSEKKRLLKELTNEINEKKEIFEELPQLYAKAIDLNLTSSKNIPENVDYILKELEKIINDDIDFIDFDKIPINKLNNQILLLENERNDVHLNILKDKKVIRLIKENIDNLNKTSFDQEYESRSELIRWLTSKIIEKEEYLSLFFDKSINFNDVISSIQKYELTSVKEENEMLNLKEELYKVENNLEQNLKRYNSLSSQLKALYMNEKDLRQYKSLQRKKYEYIGELKYKIKRYKNDMKESEIEKRLAYIEVELKRINGIVDEEVITNKFQKIDQKISDYALKILKTLDVEDYFSPINNEISELTISIDSREFGKDKDYLYQIGSASNWLSYHISYLLALHKYFASLNPKRVMNFIIFDQPSQVYFPEGEFENKNGKKDKDFENVKKIFNTLNLFNKENKEVQIIILEHAGRSIWEGYENIIEIEEWNDDVKLIPLDWFN